MSAASDSRAGSEDGAGVELGGGGGGEEVSPG